MSLKKIGSTWVNPDHIVSVVDDHSKGIPAIAVHFVSGIVERYEDGERDAWLAWLNPKPVTVKVKPNNLYS